MHWAPAPPFRRLTDKLWDPRTPQPENLEFCNKELEYIKKKQKEIKNTIAETKNTLEIINSRLDDTEEQINMREDRMIEIIKAD